jgi:hypothetical protein
MKKASPGPLFKSEQITSIEQFTKVTLNFLETDTHDVKRPVEAQALALKLVLKPKKYDFPKDDVEFRGGVEELQRIYRGPGTKDLMEATKRMSTIDAEDRVILDGIRRIMNGVFKAKLKELNQPLTDNDSSEDGNSSEAMDVESPYQSDNEQLASKESPKPELGLVPEQIGQRAPNLPDLGSGLIKNQMRTMLIKPQSHLPLLILKFKKNSVEALSTFMKMRARYRTFELPSYKIFNQEFSQVDFFREREHDNVVIYWTPKLTYSQMESLLDLIHFSEDEKQIKESYYNKEKFGFEHYGFNFTGNHRQDLQTMLHIIATPEKYSTQKNEYATLRACNLLLQHPVNLWGINDITAAEKLIRDIAKEYGGNLLLHAADLEIALGKYHEHKGDLDKASNYFIGAYSRIKYAHLDPRAQHSDIFNSDFGNPYRDIEYRADSFYYLKQERGDENRFADFFMVRKLRTIIVALDCFISITEKRESKIDLRDLNEYIRELNEARRQLLAIDPFLKVEVIERKEMPPVLKELSDADPIVMDVRERKPVERKPFFSQQVAEDVSIDFNGFLEITGFKSAEIVHIKKEIPTGLCIHLNTLEDAKRLQEKLIGVLAGGNQKKYGGKLGCGGITGQKPLVSITFDAYNDLQNLLQNNPLKSSEVFSNPK